MDRKFLCVCVLTMLEVMSYTGRAADPAVQVSVVSSRPDMVSGQDALIQVTLPPSVAPNKAKITVNGQDMSSAFHPSSSAGILLGLVTGLKTGDNAVQVFSNGKTSGSPAATLTLKDYPITGPIFSGPQEHPFICQTKDFKLPDGTLLGDPLDDNCSAKTVVTYVYKSTAPAPPSPRGRPTLNLKPLANMKSLPDDVAWTTITSGEKVPFVVRVETGTINRSIYQIAMLHDPTREPPPTPLVASRGWNHRFLYSFGGGCPSGWYKQGLTLGWANGVISDETIGKGYAEAGATLNVAGNNCNDVIATETMMMVKERFIKAYGKPAFTLSRGGSGGSYQQNQITDNYPGLLDGIIPSLTFADVQELTQMLTDSRLLLRYYTSVGDALTLAQKEAIGGVAELQNIPSSAPLAGRINASEYCPAEMPKNIRYDAKTNPTGTRCDIYDHNINMYGRDPATGFARRPIDNTGIQYGLAALNDGTITTAQFLDLNQKIGGYDNDGNMRAERSTADPLALRNAYQSGVITNAGGGLASVPIIDVRPYRDRLPDGDNHLKYHSYSYRERLQKANGTYANDVMLLTSVKNLNEVDAYALAKMDEWLTTMQKDSSSDPALTKILRAKPDDLVDSCWDPDDKRVIEQQTFSGGQCNTWYPTFPGPRMVAGGPLANNVLKCQLKPVDMSDYKVTVSAAEKSQLQQIFSTGVCDWSKPGVEQQPPTGRWQMHASAQ